MGKYSDTLPKRISDRINHTKIVEGYCLICGEFKKLTEDHVPPKGAIVITKVEQKHIGEVMNERAPNMKGVMSRNGSKFKTICKDCNSNLADGDAEIARVCKLLTPIIKNYFEIARDVYSLKVIEINAIKYMRSMIGHVLSATTVEECKTPQEETSYFTPLINFVRGDDSAIENTHEIFYWFYPYKRHLSAKVMAYHHGDNLSLISLLSFFPIAFLIVEKGKCKLPFYAQKLDTSSTCLMLDLSSKNIQYFDFPFTNLDGYQFFLMNEILCTISYPIQE